jgi:hypothetical protein
MVRLFCDSWDDLEYRQGYFIGLLFTIALGSGVGIERFFGAGLNIYGFLIVISIGYFVIPFCWDKFVLKKVRM